MLNDVSKKITIESAGAGSGKIYNLCDRSFACFEGGDALEPRGILATTFTRKAARELARRFRSRLLSGGRFELAQFVENGRIGIVPSVWLGLLRDFAFEAGISPGVSELAEDV